MPAFSHRISQPSSTAYALFRITLVGDAFIGTRQDTKSINVTLARISAEAKIDPDNLDVSTFNLTVYAANENAVSDPDRRALAAISAGHQFPIKAHK